MHGFLLLYRSVWEIVPVLVPLYANEIKMSVNDGLWIANLE